MLTTAHSIGSIFFS